MELSIIIVNWNSVEFLKECISSIIANVNNLRYEVIVVDNASYDGSEEVIRTKFPTVKFIQSDKNVGFARANNLGSKSAQGEKLLFLNPDTEIIGSAVNVMMSSLDTLPGAGIVGCKLLNSDMSVQISCIQPFPTIMNQVLDIHALKTRFPNLDFWGIRPLFVDNGSPEEVSVISGACMMVKKSVFEKIGLFSADYFMYSEDVDLCYKAKKLGYKVYYNGEATVIHFSSGSSKNKKETFFGVVLMRESIFKFIEKTRGRSNALLYKTAMFANAVGRLILIAVILPLAVVAGYKEKLWSTFNKWKKVLRWSLGLEKWAGLLSNDR